MLARGAVTRTGSVGRAKPVGCSFSGAFTRRGRRGNPPNLGRPAAIRDLARACPCRNREDATDEGRSDRDSAGCVAILDPIRGQKPASKN